MGLIHKNAIADGPVTPKGPAELNQHNNNSSIIMQTLDHEQQKVRGGITGEGQELSAEDESRINGDENHEILNNHIQMEVVGLTNDNTTEKQQQQESQTQASSLVRWERFLPLRSLKVLLVENDDSTRHVVSALLRNCGYEVVSVANGVQAWKVLEDLTADIDLVLTEVTLPCLTGIGLLSKIMNHKTCKNIPVIMMSSHDSMSIVFKCLSKGAVDFLVKPIRKNELKNLWQHVWRKCHSSSGSGSESGVRTQKSLKSDSAEHSDNKQHENYDGDDIGSIGLNARDRSDNGSGTQQSSWTKIAVEVDSPRQMSPWNPFVDPPGSTCAQVISIPSAIDNNGVPKTNGCEKQDDVFAIELETGIPSIPLLQPQGQWEEVPSNLQGCNKQNMSEKKNTDEEKEKRQVELTIERTTGEYQNQVAEPTCVETNNSIDPLSEIQVLDKQNGKVSMVKDRKNYADKRMPSFEFSSKSLTGVGDLGSSTIQDQNILRQSNRSAFSRYNSTSHQARTGNVGSCSPIDNSSEAAKTESLQCLQSHLNVMPPNQQSNGSNNNNDMGSSTNNAFTKPSTTIAKPTQKPTVKYVHPSSASQSVQNASPQPISQENGEKQQIQVQFSHHHYHHHHHHHMHNMIAQQLINQNGQSLQKETTKSHHDAPSTLLNTPIKHDGGNQSLNGSASGSNQGSNVQIGSNATLLESLPDMEKEMRLVEKDGTTSAVRFENANAIIHNRFAQREAALNKFRQKRKERCFEKKVRYQSRKKLAEQRPRVRGQFVKQIVDINKGNISHQ